MIVIIMTIGCKTFVAIKNPKNCNAIRRPQSRYVFPVAISIFVRRKSIYSPFNLFSANFLRISSHVVFVSRIQSSNCSVKDLILGMPGISP